MEHNLTCNHLRCRKELSDRALVTTCSHIFCLECAQQLGVTGQHADKSMNCPACKSPLTKGDDAVIANLNPSEDYKTSVLSGLSPNVIMECAGRALSFWAYQASQDMYYQQYLYKTLNEKYSALSMQLDKTVNDANSEIENLQSKLKGIAAEHDTLRRKNEELVQAYKEKNKKLLQTQELYDKVKRKAEMGNIQRAACDAVDSSLHYATQHINSGEMEQTRSVGDQQSPSAINQMPNFDNFGGMNTGLPRVRASYPNESRWDRANNASAQPIGGVMRQRLGVATIPGTSGGYPRLGGTPISGQPPVGARAATNDVNMPSFASNRAGFSGLGLTSGLKVSQPASIGGLDASSRTH